jgi:hypothetical protein
MPYIAKIDDKYNITFISTYDEKVTTIAEIFKDEEKFKMRIKELDGIGNRSIISKCKNGKYNIVIHKKSVDKIPAFINIDLYNKKFEQYPSDLVQFAREHNLKLLPLTSMRGQALALMSQPEVKGQKYIGRDEAVKFFKNIGMKTRDAIQQFNKATGLERIKKKGLSTAPPKTSQTNKASEIKILSKKHFKRIKYKKNK